MNIATIIETYIFSNTFLESGIVILLGLFLRIILASCKQLWVTTFHQTMTFMMLPVTTYIITKVISGNIALSLGMVGALSIVRFRNPVKNPFELVIFFSLITIGIGMAIKIKYGIALSFFVVSTIISCQYLELLFKKFGLSIFSISFDEGNNLNILEICCDEKIEQLEKSNFLNNIVIDKNKNLILYRLASNNKSEIKKIYEEFKENKKVTTIDFQASQ